MKRQVSILKTLSRLLGYIVKRHKFITAFVIILALLTTASEITASLFIRDLIDVYITPMLQSPEKDFSLLIGYLMQVGVVFLVGVIAFLISVEIVGYITEKVLYEMRQEVFEKAQVLPISYFDSHPFGETMGLFTNDMDTISDVILSSLPDVLRMSISIFFVFITMIVTSPFLSSFVVGYIVLFVIITLVLSKKSAKYFRGNQKALAALNGYVEESLNAQKVIKSFNYEERNTVSFSALNNDWGFNTYKAHKYSNIYMPILANLGNLLYVILVVVGVVFSLKSSGLVSVGTVVMFLQLTRSFTGPFANMANHMNMIIRAVSGAERIFEFLDQEEEEDNGTIVLDNPEGEIRFHNVTFSYDGKEDVLHDISLYAKKGQKIAFVGATGAGKTTIINLLTRFYDVQEGKITFDGIDIKDIKKSSLRSTLAMVLQDTYLFSGTIRDNIRYGNLEATDREVEAAAELVGADTFIKHLKDGYDTYINGNDTELSMGQKQLISIARAAVANPKVMILDEATSSIDSESEAIIQKGLYALMKGRTVFVIAHRLSTIRDANAIMVMDHGRIIERGTEAELIELGGRYQALKSGRLELD